jgi:hypothetical protein
MLLVDPSLTDLVSGYDLLQIKESELNNRWRGRLLAAYAKRRSSYEDEITDYRKRKAEFLARMRIGIWLSSGLFILGVVALPAIFLVGELGNIRGPLFCFSPLMILAGLNGWAILAGFWFWDRERTPPKPPIHPLKENILVPLFGMWREGMRSGVSEKNFPKVLKGTLHLIARLQTVEPDSYLLSRLRTNANDEIPLAIIGNRGVWVFEVVDLEGVIRWQDGKWTVRKSFSRSQAQPILDINKSEIAYEKAWEQKSKQIAQMLKDSIPELSKNFPKVLNIRGGIVFTNPRAKFQIPESCPFNWGVIPFWLDKIQNVPNIPGLDERSILQIIEALLTHHQQIEPLITLRSMLSVTDQTIHQAEQHLESWILV